MCFPSLSTTATISSSEETSLILPEVRRKMRPLIPPRAPRIQRIGATASTPRLNDAARGAARSMLRCAQDFGTDSVTINMTANKMTSATGIHGAPNRSETKIATMAPSASWAPSERARIGAIRPRRSERPSSNSAAPGTSSSSRASARDLLILFNALSAIARPMSAAMSSRPTMMATALLIAATPTHRLFRQACT